MTPLLDPEEVLNYLRNDAFDGGLPSNSFAQIFPFFVAVLTKLEWASTDAALANVALQLKDEERQWLNRFTEAANRIDEATIAQAITEDLFHEQKEPRFGESNPHLLNLPYWIFMVRCNWTAWQGRMQFEEACRVYMQYLRDKPGNFLQLNEKEQESFWADAPDYKYGNAVWSFNRFGATHTPLADGRQIWIAGEHEDWYDCDFHIYNDVIVIGPNFEVDIYCYPLSVFKPTDFHTATLVDNSIYIIGRLGYHGTRQPGVTPVYRLDCATFQIEQITTTGENPGWIYRHQAEYVAQRNAIKVTKGDIFLRFEGKRPSRKNRATYWLDVATGQWSRGRGNER